MLTPQQIDAARQKFGITPAAPSLNAPDKVASMSDAWAAADAKKTDTYPNRVQKNMEKGADIVGKGFQEGGASIVADVQNTTKKNLATPNPVDKILNTLVLAGHVAGTVAKTAGKVVEGSIKTAASPISQVKTVEGDTLGEHFTAPVRDHAQKLLTALAESHPEVIKWVAKQADAHPDIARGIGDVVNTLALEGMSKTTVGGTDIGNIKDVAANLKSGVQDIVSKVNSTANDAADLAKGAAQKTKSMLGIKSEVDKTISAVNPDLSGKKLIGAYEDVVRGSRTASGGRFTEQKLSPGQQAINVGTRLSNDVSSADGEVALPKMPLKGKPVKDLKTLADGMQKTEEKITGLLEGDPTLVYNADKPTLIGALDEIKSKSPREFGSIKDSKALYDDVIDYAKETVANADDTVTGIRDARSTFDTMAKKQFPSAYKDGFIDTKTPAGIAIKAARDTINEHLYNTAPEGSVIKDLILRESDIFKAAQSIAAKAAQTHGTNVIGRALDALRAHPYLSAIGVYETAKHTIAPALPGV